MREGIDKATKRIESTNEKRKIRDCLPIGGEKSEEKREIRDP